MPKLVASIPKLGLSPKADDARQLYVLAFASDSNIKENNEKDILGAMNVTLPTVVPDIAAKDAMNWMLASVSNIFPVSRSFPQASLSGSGIMLYPNLDPKGFFALQIFVIESDDNHRRLGEKLEKILGDDKVKGAVDALTKKFAQPLVASLMGAVTSATVTLFKNSKDDILLAHGHTGFDFDNYGLDEDEKIRDFALATKLIEGTLRLRINS